MKNMSFRKVMQILFSIALIFNAISISKPISVNALGNTAYYVDNINGNDSNNGLSIATPWKTLSKVSSLSFAPGDSINLKSGEIWNESLNLNGQGTLASPITVQSYGTGNKPKIRSNAASVVGGTNIGGWTIKGLTVECTTTDTMNVGGQNSAIEFTYTTTGSYNNINITDNEIFAGGIDTNTNGIRIITLASNDYTGRVLTDININNNLIYNIGWLGIATTGWNTTQNRDLHSTQLYGNINVNGNTVHNTACQGITIHSADTGYIKRNLVYDCGQYTGTNVSWGTSGIWCMLSSNIDIKFNEVYNQSETNFTNYDACGFDIDWTFENINVQYNYAHDNKGAGIETMSNINSTIMYNRISNNRGLSGVGNGQITLTSYTGNPEAMTGLTNLNVSNNLIFVNKINTVALVATVNINGIWSGNSFNNNNIILSTEVAGTKVYDLVANANIATANDNNIYSTTGSTFIGTKNNTNYNSLSSWRTGTGFDLNSITATLETTVPTAVAGLSATQGTGLSFNLTWTASTDSGRGISHYNIHRSTSSTFTPSYTNMVGEATTNSFTDTEDLTSGITYYYKVTAEDKCGNVGVATETSPFSSTLTVDTPTIVDGKYQVRVSNAAADEQVSILVAPVGQTPTRNNIIYVGQTTSDAQGIATFLFKLKAGATGTYTVRVGSSSNIVSNTTQILTVTEQPYTFAIPEFINNNTAVKYTYTKNIANPQYMPHLIVAYYNDNKLLNVAVHMVETSLIQVGSQEIVNVNLSIPENATLIKAFVWCGFDKLESLATAQKLYHMDDPNAEINEIVGSKEIIVSKDTRLSKGLNWWTDGNLGVIKNGENYDFYAANGQQTAKTSGTLDNMVSTVSYTGLTIQNMKNTFHYSAGGPVYKDTVSGKLVMLYHAEKHRQGDPQKFYSSLCMAVSNDNGATFSDLGEIITPNTLYSDMSFQDTIEMGGAPYVINDGYMYVFFNDRLRNGTYVNFGVARCSLISVMEAVNNGTAPIFNKYYSGAFSEAGISGMSSSLDNTYSRWFDVCYSEKLNKFVMVAAQNATNGCDLYFSTSIDGITWTPRKLLENEVGESFYCTLVGKGENPKLLGESFYVYYTHSATGDWGRWDDANVVRREIILVKNEWNTNVLN